MNSSSHIEKAILNFYQWELRGRGYAFYDTPVALEAPFVPFKPTRYRKEKIDDGLVPSLWSRLRSTFIPERIEEEEDISWYFPAKDDTELCKLTTLELYFPPEIEISQVLSQRFLESICIGYETISFEIFADSNRIKVRLVVDDSDTKRVRTQLTAFFPQVVILEPLGSDIVLNNPEHCAIADFGLNDEFMRPLALPSSYALDPLTSAIGILGSLKDDEQAMIQIIFQGCSSPWSRHLQASVSDGRGGSFFEDSPEMPKCAEVKSSAPLFSVVMRVVVSAKHSQYARSIFNDIATALTHNSSSEFNKIIALSNEGYSYDQHLENVYLRKSNRLGCILNAQELSCFVHYPNKTIHNSKLRGTQKRSKGVPKKLLSGTLFLGINHHNHRDTEVYLSEFERLEHIHVIGATGTGKSTLIANMVLQDIDAGNGCAVFDPHGDLCDDILKRIPEHRIPDVIFINPSDTDFPIGFNLLEAHSDIEKIVLSSDLVSAFKRHATSWGDNMSAVFHNAINTFLESTDGGTLIELKRFLVDDAFRASFLKNVHDESLVYYWFQEYPLMKRGITPLLTRIDTFLRPKIIKAMVAQREGISIAECIEQKKIVCITLSQGMIGEENSYLLASLLITKFNQAAMKRQMMSKEQRHPYFLYIDEFQNFVTPSTKTILSGARKYGLGLCLSHQDMLQIQDTSIVSSLLSNPASRICFRLGGNDAQKLASGFSFFQADDFQNLKTGECIIKVQQADQDCNVLTLPLSKAYSEATKDAIIAHSRSTYARPLSEVEKILAEGYQHSHQHSSQKKKQGLKPSPEREEKPRRKESSTSDDSQTQKLPSLKELDDQIYQARTHSKEHQDYLDSVTERESISLHRSLQKSIKEAAISRGYAVALEEKLDDSTRVDVSLTQGQRTIAIEISVTNTVEYEVHNITKCLTAGYTSIYMVSEKPEHLTNIKDLLKKQITAKEFKKVAFGNPQECVAWLDSLDEVHSEKPVERRVRGYRVKSTYVDTQEYDNTERANTIQSIILKSLKKPNT